MIAHRIAEKKEFDQPWVEFAYSEYIVALEQMSPNAKFVPTCVRGKEELYVHLAIEPSTEKSKNE